MYDQLTAHASYVPAGLIINPLPLSSTCMHFDILHTHTLNAIIFNNILMHEVMLNTISLSLGSHVQITSKGCESIN